MTTDKPYATYTRLRNGDWGVRVPGCSVTPGDTVEIHRKDGSTQNGMIERVLWTGNGVSICSLESVQNFGSSSYRSSGRSSGRRRYTPTGCSCGSVEEFSRDSDCESCRFDAE